MRVLGIDPSANSTGFGILEFSKNTYFVHTYGAIKPARKKPFHHKINEIRTRLEELIHKFQPVEVAIENLFYAQNIKTALTLGQVRGAVLIAVSSQDCPLHEYSPLEIKKAVTGYGQADKNQVQIMIKTLLDISDDRMELDASDALATALCHLNSRIFLDQVKSPQ